MIEHKRFLVFAGDHYYPAGGWSDLQGAYETLDEATAAMKAEAEDSLYRWANVVDLQTGKEVAYC